MTPPLHERLGLGDRELIAIVGAGGKSTVLFGLGTELAARGSRVVLTTTTKMGRTQVTDPACWSDDPKAIDVAFQEGRPLFVAMNPIPGKVTGPSPGAVDRLFAESTAAYVIVEADGARSMSVKAPAEHEPVIPSRSTLVIVVAGIDAVGRSVREVAHRPDRIAALTGLGPDSILTVADLAAILLHTHGGLKGIPDSARVAMAITKMTPETERAATELERLLRHQIPVGHVVTLEQSASSASG
jgi:molybdenum cofactor cytidylyltransferase